MNGEEQTCALERPNDDFKPILEGAHRLPNDVRVMFIEREDQVGELECLFGSQLIGVDSEGRPQLCSLTQNSPCILQISDTKNAFLIDLLKLSTSQHLNQTLTKIFQNP